MNIKAVSLTNVQGISDQFDLKPLNLIVGPNGSGKTTLAKAIRFGLAGQLPVLGKAQRSTWRMAGNQTDVGTMEIALVIQDGKTERAVVHSWANNKGRISYNSTLTPDIAWPSAMLDFRTFLSMPGADQARALFARVKLDEPKVRGAFRKAITDVAGDTGHPQHARKVLERLADGVAVQKAATPHEWVEKAMVVVVDAAKAAKRGMENSSAQSVGHRESEPEKVDNPTEPLNEANKVVDDLQKQTAKSGNAWRAYERALAAHTSAKEALARHNALAESLKNGIMEKTETNVAAMRKNHSCPTCGSGGKGWLSKIEVECNKLNTHRDAEIAKINAESQRLAAQLEANPKPDKPEETTKGLTDRLVEMQEKVRELSVQKSQFDAYETWRNRRDELEKAAVENAVEFDACDKAAKAAKAWRQKMINEGINDSLKVANRFTVPFGMTMEWNAELEEFGRQTNNGWISLDTFSGSEEQIAFAGLSLAVCSTAAKVIIFDEMGRFTPLRKIQVFNVADSLIDAGVIDQFIGIDVAETSMHSPSDINIIRFK